MTHNPFQYSRPVQPDALVGRQSSLHALLTDLTSPNGDSYAIIAGRRCGKSSYLQALDRQIRLLATASAGDLTVLPVRVNLSAVRQDSPECVLASLLSEINRRVGKDVARRPHDAWPAPLDLASSWYKDLLNKSAISTREFGDALGYVCDEICTQSQRFARIVLLLDGLDAVLDKTWTETFFGQLRSLLQESETVESLRLVLAGSGSFLDRLGKRGSPLENAVKVEYLLSIDSDSIRQLAASVPKTAEEAKSEVCRLSGGNAFLAQYLLHHAWTSTIGVSSEWTVEIIDQAAVRFFHEQAADIEAWVQAIGLTGVASLIVLAESDGWVDEPTLRQRAGQNAIDLKRSLVSLCYHGFIQHEGHWERYRRTGDLMSIWCTTYGGTMLDRARANQTSPQDLQSLICAVVGDINLSVSIGDRISIGNISGNNSIAAGRDSSATGTGAM